MKNAPSITDLLQRKTLRYREIERAYGIPYSTVKKIAAKGELTIHRIGPKNGTVLVDRLSLEAYLQRNGAVVAA